MPIDMSTMEGRHLVLAYGAVALIQGGYFLWVARGWMRLWLEEKKQRSQPRPASLSEEYRR